MAFRKSLSFVLILVGSLWFSPARAQSQAFHIAYDGGMLSVSLKDAKLDRVLAAIAEKAGISVDLPENLSQSVTIEFDRVPLEDGLYMILRDVNHVLIFSPSKKNDEPIVSGVYIPPEKLKGRRRLGVTRTAPPEGERGETTEEARGRGDRMGEPTEEEVRDPVLERYDGELRRLEQQLEAVGEESPQGKALMIRMRRLESQIERRLEDLENEELQ